MTLKSYKYRLYPSKAQALLLDQTLETCRRWYNNCLTERKEAYETEKRTVGKYEQLRKVKELKQSNPYAASVHSGIVPSKVRSRHFAFADKGGSGMPVSHVKSWSSHSSQRVNQ